MPTTKEIREAAAARGRTRVVDMSPPAGNLIVWVRPDQDLDDEFSATCAETGDVLRINGWMLPLHDDADRRAELRAEFGA